MPSLEHLFSLSSSVVTPIWLLLIFAPRWRWTQWLATFIAPLSLGTLYAVVLLKAPAIHPTSYSTLAQVEELFTSPPVVLAGWIHYLAFDLFTGSWEARDAVRIDLPRWLVAPCLILTFLFGPIGLMLYLLLRLVLRKQVSV